MGSGPFLRVWVMAVNVDLTAAVFPIWSVLKQSESGPFLRVWVMASTAQ